MNDVLIIIVTYNGATHIRQCLTSFDTGNPRVTCMVVDNGSTDDTVKIIQNEFPEVILVEGEKNLGFGAANNIGLRYALKHGYRYAYLLNQDAWISPEDLERLIEIAERNKEFGLLSPLQVYAGKNQIDNNFAGNITKEMKDDFLLPDNKPKELYEVKNTTLQAAHWMLLMDAVRKVGGFSPAFFHYGEDANMRRRMHYHGIKMGLVPSILAVHNRENRTNSLSYFFLLSTNAWIQTFIDPNLDKRTAVKQTFVCMAQTFCSFKRRFFPALFKFLKDIPKLSEYRRKSIDSDTPFL